MSIKVYTDINKLSSKLWNQINENIFFVNYRFLKSFFNNHKSIIHLFILDGSSRV